MASLRPRARAGRVLITVATAVLALLAPLFVAESSAGAMTPTESGWSQAIVNMINRERAAHHLPALGVRLRLTNSARSHNLAMARANVMSHQLPGEAPLGTRISRTSYQWHWIGENVAWNSDVSLAGLRTLQRMMYNEVPPDNGHRLNILSRNFRNVGVDVYIDHLHHKVWMTEDFGAH